MRRCRTWPELIEQLYEGAWNGELQRYRAPWIAHTAAAQDGSERSSKREHSDTLTVEMLSAFTSLRACDSLSRQTFLAFIEPPSLDTRILNQFALFSLMSDPASSLDQWVRTHPRLCRRVLVPAELKWEVRDKLDQANINERTLLPGLDGLSRWLERYYYPRR